MKKILSSLILTLTIGLVYSQDTIVLKSGTRIIGVVLEVGTDSVCFTFCGNDDPVMTITTDYIRQIRFGPNAAGNKYFSYRPATDTLNAGKSLKLGVFAPAFGHFYLSYEKALKNNVSMEFHLGGILDQKMHMYTDYENYGFYMRTGLRFYLKNKMKYDKVLTYSPVFGNYLGLIMTHTFFQYRNSYSTYDYNTAAYNYNSTTVQKYSGSFHWVYGLQFPIGKHLIFNPALGVGFTLTRQYGYSNNNGYEYTVAKPFENAFSLTSMFQFGYVY